MSENRRKIILFYNPSSGNGLFKHYLDDIIGRCQDEGYMRVLLDRKKNYGKVNV